MSDPASRIFLQTNPEGIYMRYDGVTMTATKRMANRWQGVFSLVLSKSAGRLGSSARFTPTSAQSSQAGSFGRDAAGPNDYVNTEGRLIGDRPVVAKAQVLYQFPWGSWLSQRAAPDRATLRACGPGQRSRLPVGAADHMEANTGDCRVEDVNLLDARIQKAFRLSGESLASKCSWTR